MRAFGEEVTVQENWMMIRNGIVFLGGEGKYCEEIKYKSNKNLKIHIYGE